MAEVSEERRKEVEERAAHNMPVIERFRASGGQSSGTMPIVLLHHKGAKSGVERVNPVAYLQTDAGIAVFASNAGRDSNPDWYYNLVAHPETVVELGTETVTVRARVATAEERAPIWEAQKAAAAVFADYETKTSREIPVVLLERNLTPCDSNPE